MAEDERLQFDVKSITGGKEAIQEMLDVIHDIVGSCQGKKFLLRCSIKELR